MADNNEDIIIIEEGEVVDNSTTSNENTVSEDADLKKKKKLLLIGGGAVIAVLLILVAVLVVYKLSNKEVPLAPEPSVEKSAAHKQKPIEQSKLENMVAKANYLYANGSKEDALTLYEKIALYSEAISLYNLGVAQLINKQYDMALATFAKAIQNDEQRCVSAINAAVCALHLGDKKNFRYYIDLAYAYLPSEANSPLYSYYYALINYYNENYLEALSALKNPTSDEYPEIQKHLSAKIDALYGNNMKAIESMQKEFAPQDALSLGLLYARVGDTTLAQKYLEEAVQKNIEPIKSQLALSFVNIKAGLVSTGAKDIQILTDSYPNEVYKYYPLKVNLKESLFEPEAAQELYRTKVEKSKLLTYQKIFYFSPYKVFNADKTLNSIKKGNANIYIDDVSSATKYLEQSASSSNVNFGIAKAIKKALTFKIREANEELEELVKIQPKHSILHYNLALTYAQMGNMQDAHTHFLRSYYLDAKNYMSGVYAIMTSQLINKENEKLNSIISDSIMQEQSDENIELDKTLLNISSGNMLANVDWLDNNYTRRPLYLALDTIIALQLHKEEDAKKASEALTELLPHDILPHMMYIDSHFNQLKSKEYAKEVSNYLKAQKLYFTDLYYGPQIVSYLYVHQNLITGRLFYLREQLKDVLDATAESPYELTGVLALASFYDKAYEESYTLYNQLIDEFKVRDANTLFMGAVASTAANHHPNAIALLELSKMKDTNFLESRYALGLLYLELRNNEGGVNQLIKIGDKGFISEFFNFEIDLDKLLFEKQNYPEKIMRMQEDVKTTHKEEDKNTTAN
ncbi:MAG: tetratricopeptide repeat protein [Sulfurimonas sp.]|jgi:Flp pilus assembly protein TadD